MNSTSNTRTSLFLMELIISVLFLSLSGAVCVQMFVKAHLTGKKSVDTNNAVIWTQNLSESFQGVDGDIDRLFDLYDTLCVRVDPVDDSDNEGTLILFMDSDWNSIEYPASDLSGVSASFEVFIRIRRISAYDLYKDTDISADSKSLLQDSGLMTRCADIVVMNVEGNGLVDEIPENPVPGEGGVISAVTATCITKGDKR